MPSGPASVPDFRFFGSFLRFPALLSAVLLREFLDTRHIEEGSA
jgi:hypothetical protein